MEGDLHALFVAAIGINTRDAILAMLSMREGSRSKGIVRFVVMFW
jgi:hypothetical protein